MNTTTHEESVWKPGEGRQNLDAVFAELGRISAMPPAQDSSPAGPSLEEAVCERETPETVLGRRDSEKPTLAPTAKPIGGSRRFGWVLMVVCVLGSVLCFAHVFTNGFAGSTPSQAKAAPPAKPVSRLLTRKIRDIHPGMRVLADNPELAGQTIAP